MEVKMKRQVFLAATHVVLMNAENILCPALECPATATFLAKKGFFFVG
jgi:hypothetical protein